MRRMDKYESQPKIRRIDRNQSLYQGLSNNTILTNITDITNSNAYEINSINTNTNKRQSRESYHQLQGFQRIEPVSETKKEIEELNNLYQGNKKKVYDINSVLEEARKNRVATDELEEKRKLKNSAYNILSSANKEKLAKYREEKKNRKLTKEEEEIRELVNTIASKTLAGELDQATSVDLLSDLMATNILDKVDPMEDNTNESTNTLTLSEQIINISEIKELDEKTKNAKLDEKDQEFYTRSMDLSDKDFDLSNEFEEEKTPLYMKIIIFTVIAIMIAIITYLLWKKII